LHLAIAEVVELADTEGEKLPSGAVFYKAAGDPDGQLVGVIEAVVASKAAVAKQLLIGKGQRGGIKIGLVALIGKLGVAVKKPRLQGLG